MYYVSIELVSMHKYIVHVHEKTCMAKQFSKTKGNLHKTYMYIQEQDTAWMPMYMLIILATEHRAVGTDFI